MKTIQCPTHGEQEAILTDGILIRYTCKKCKDKKKKEEGK